MAESRVVIRTATERDLPSVIALEQATFTSHAITPRQMRYLLRNPKSIFLVAIAKPSGGGLANLAGDAVALIRRSPSGRLAGRIYSVVVDPAHRGQKIGQKLTAALLRRLERAGVERVYLEVQAANAGAIHIYERLGFRELKPLHHYYGRGRHGKRFYLPLPPPRLDR